MDDVNPAGVLETLAYTTVWIIISGSVIIYNKWILTVLPFPFPIALTMTHMAFNSILATICVWSGLVPINKETVSRNIYVKGIIPVAGLFSVVLWLGNAAYLFLSVSFIQMLKALMPAFVYVVSVAFTLTTFSWGKLSNICLICAGVAIAAFGEIQFNLIGLNLQIASSLAEALRLALLQILLQKRGIKLNPISTLYYIAPPCFVFLCIPFIIIEMPKLVCVKFQLFLLSFSRIPYHKVFFQVKWMYPNLFNVLVFPIDSATLYPYANCDITYAYAT